MMGNGAIALVDCLALLPWHLRVTSTSRSLEVLLLSRRTDGRIFEYIDYTIPGGDNV